MKPYLFVELNHLIKEQWRRWGRKVAQVLIAFVVAIGTAALWLSYTGDKLDKWVLQSYFSVRGERKPPADIVIVSIDSEAYQKLNASDNFPLPRHYIADALERIVQAQPKAIIIDGKLPNERDRDPAADNRIAEALRSGPTTIWSGRSPASPAFNTQAVTVPSDELFQNAAKLELPMSITGVDDTLMFIADSDAPNASLFERVPIARALVELGKLNIGKPGPDDLINFYGTNGTIPRISIYDFINVGDSALAQAKVKGKIVLIGYHSIKLSPGTTIKDQFNIPFGRAPMFGVEIHGNIIANLLDGTWLKRPPFKVELVFLLIVSIVIATVAMALTPEKSVFAVAAIMAILLCGCYVAFTYEHWVAGIGSLLVSSVVSIVVGIFFHYVTIKGFKKYLARTFKFEFEREV